MKVAIVRSFPSNISISDNTYNVQEIGLAKGFLDLGHECDIYWYTSSDDYKDEIKYKNSIINFFHCKSKKILYYGLFSKKTLNSIGDNYDLIVSNEYCNFASLFFAKNYSNKLAIYHGPYVSKYTKKLNILMSSFDFLFLKYFKNKNIRVYTKSKIAEEQLEKKGFICQTVGVGLDTTNLLYSDSINRDDFGLLYVGKLEDRRNILFMIEIIKELVKINPKYKLTIIGTGKSKYLEKVHRKVNEYRLDDNIIFLGKIKQNDLYKYYLANNIFLLPTKYEIFGMVLLESIYYGCTPISSINGGSTTLFDNQKFGKIVENFDLNLWIKQIAKTKTNKDDFSKKYIELNFNWKITANKFIYK